MFSEDGSLVSVAIMRNVQTHELTVLCAECDEEFNRIGVLSHRALREAEGSHKNKYFIYRDKRIYLSWLKLIPH